MRLDLHIHSTASDGAFSPGEVVRAAVAGRLDVIALSDHDTTAGIRAATEAGEGLPLQVIPAIEASSTREGREFHFLGYFVDPHAPELVAHEGRAIRLRHDRIARMVTLLGKEGIDVDFDAVLEEAGPERSSLGRPHLARALVTAGHVASVPEAFDRYIGDSHRAFIPTELLTPAEAIALILGAGGIPVWAHPPGDAVEPLLPELVAAGLRGLEVYRPRSHPQQVARLEKFARSHDLLLTGGSDWHTPDSGSVLGDFAVTGEDIRAFLHEAGM
jgi:3',5'-nucleoside bisphosphate phosphatase